MPLVLKLDNLFENVKSCPFSTYLIPRVIIRVTGDGRTPVCTILCLEGMVPERHSVLTSTCPVCTVLVELGLATGEPANQNMTAYLDYTLI